MAPVPGIEIRIYSADWCGPCQFLHHSLDAAGYHDLLPVQIGGHTRQITIITVDTTNWDWNEAERNGIDGYPTSQVRIHGHVVGTVMGGMSADRFRESVQAVLDRNQSLLATP